MDKIAYTLTPCRWCGHETGTQYMDKKDTQRYAQVMCENCGSRGPSCKNESEAHAAWDSTEKFVPVAPDPSKCIACGWNGENSEIKDMKPHGNTVHWTCPQCGGKRVTIGEPVNKMWS